MACAYHINPERQLVLLRPAGQFTETDFIALCRAVYADPKRKPQFHHVWDTRAVDELIMNVDVIPMYRDFLNEYQAQATEGKVAIVTTRTVVKTFASMLMQIGRSRATFRLFSTMEEAAEWIDLCVDVLTDIPEAQWQWTEP